MIGKHNGLAQLAADPVTLILAREKALQPLRRYIGRDQVRVNAVAREVQRIRSDIGSKDLQLRGTFGRGELFEEQHGEGICLLAGAATRHPDPDRLVGGLLHERGNDRLRQSLEGRGIPKKAGHVDEKVLREQFDLIAVLAQFADVIRDLLDSGSRHPP